MTSDFRSGRSRTSYPSSRADGKIERILTVEFCESRDCARLADWKIGYGAQSVDLCSRHTLTTMRSRRVWAGRF